MGKKRTSSVLYVYQYVRILVIISTILFVLKLTITHIPLFNMKSSVVNGEIPALSEDIERSIDNYIGENIYSLDKAELQDSLSKLFPVIMQNKISRRPMSRIRVNYESFKPFAIVKLRNGKNYYINSQMTILEQVGYGYLTDSVPIISLNSKNMAFEYGTVLTDSTSIRMVDYLKKITKAQPSFIQSISEVLCIEDKIYIRDALHGNIIYIGKNSISSKINLYNEFAESYISGLYINLNFKKQVITKRADF